MPLPIRVIRGLSDPRRIATCAAWWDAADSTTVFSGSDGTGSVSSGGTVGHWVNKAASNAATQATLNNRPRWDTGVRNGLPALFFDGDNDGLEYATSLQPANSGSMTIFAVVQKSAHTGSRGTILTERKSAAVCTLQAGMLVSSQYNVYSDGASSIAGVAASVADLMLSWCVIEATHVVGSRLALAVNRTSRTVSSLFGDGNCKALSGSAGGRIGYREGSVGQWMTGYIGELIVYSSDIGSAAKTAVNQYLSAKWGVA